MTYLNIDRRAQMFSNSYLKLLIQLRPSITWILIGWIPIFM